VFAFPARDRGRRHAKRASYLTLREVVPLSNFADLSRQNRRTSIRNRSEAIDSDNYRCRRHAEMLPARCLAPCPQNAAY